MKISGNSAESKVTFKDGERIRCIRGVISAEDDFFITMQRRDGTLRLNKNQVLKVEEWNSNDKVRSDEHEQI